MTADYKNLDKLAFKVDQSTNNGIIVCSSIHRGEIRIHDNIAIWDSPWHVVDDLLRNHEIVTRSIDPYEYHCPLSQYCVSTSDVINVLDVILRDNVGMNYVYQIIFTPRITCESSGKRYCDVKIKGVFSILT